MRLKGSERVSTKEFIDWLVLTKGTELQRKGEGSPFITKMWLSYETANPMTHSE
jgi:hypothetical protein